MQVLSAMPSPAVALMFCAFKGSVYARPMNCRAFTSVIALILFCCRGAVLGETQLTGEAHGPAEPLSLWYRQPATNWVEALPIGNGRLGAMVFGGVNEERLQLNEETLWAGGPYDPVNPDAAGALPEAAEQRQLVVTGEP